MPISRINSAAIANGAIVVADLADGSITSSKLTSSLSITGNFLANNITGNTNVITAAGSAGAPAIQPTGDTNTGIFFPAADTIAFAEGGAEAMRIDSAGDVGIGNNDPQAKLSVGAGTTAPGFGTASKMIYLCDSGQCDVLIRETGGSVVTSLYATSTYGSIRTATNHPLLLETNNTERMRIDSSGDVAIGATSVSSVGAGYRTLQMSGSTGAGLSLSRTSSTTLNYQHYVGDAIIDFYTAGTAAYRFFNSGTERARITSGGDLAVGGTDSYGRITAYTADGATPPFYTYNAVSVDCSLMNFASGTTRTYRGEIFYNNAANELRFSGKASGTYSDARLKNITDTCKYGLDTVINLSTKTFTWVRNGTEDIGLVAQELHQSIPEAVEVGNDGDIDPTSDFDPRDIWKIDYAKLTPVLIKAIQELKAITDAQATRIEALEAEVAAMKAGNGN